jgi:uncharacterized Fe-S radical SAM superfamily protein PflX
MRTPKDLNALNVEHTQEKSKMKNPVHIYYWNTNTKPGFCDLWVWYQNDEEAYFFDQKAGAKNVNYVTLTNTVTYFVRKGFEPLALLEMSEFKDKYPVLYNAIERMKDDTTVS